MIFVLFSGINQLSISRSVEIWSVSAVMGDWFSQGFCLKA